MDLILNTQLDVQSTELEIESRSHSVVETLSIKYEFN